MGGFIVVSLVAMFAASTLVDEVPWIGMTMSRLPADVAQANGIPADRGGVMVEDVEGIAARAGVRQGDVLLAVNGTPVRDLANFSRLTEHTSLSGGVALDVVRNGMRRSLFVAPGQVPALPAVVGQGAQLPAAPGVATNVMGRRWLGVEAENLAPGNAVNLGVPAGIGGVLIEGVATGSRGERAGLLPNDVIVAVNEQAVPGTVALWGMLHSLPVTAPLTFGVYRYGRPISVSLPADAGVAGALGAQVGGFVPRGRGAGMGMGGRGCFACPGCGTTVTQPGGAQAGRALLCPGCGRRMSWRLN